MRILFDMDKKDYNPDGKVFSRPSVRGVISRDGKVLLVYSKKYNYFKFPGGGIEEKESHSEALAREVQEETGYRIIPAGVEEFGKVIRKQRDSFKPDCIFLQENYYYMCRVEDECGETRLDDYEAEEGFTPVWMDPFDASHCNRYCNSEDVDHDMVMREARVLDLVDTELRKKSWEEHERETINKLGNPEYAEMLKYVEGVLSEVPSERVEAKTSINYSRFEHIKHVLGWAKRLYDLADNKDELRYDDIMIASIFHDIGRNVNIKGLSHAEAGIPLTREYLEKHGYPKERIEYICSLVGQHSDKWKMRNNQDLDKNLLLLMEADLLDDMGALGIIMDSMIVMKRNPEAVFKDCLNHIERFTYRQMQDNPMVSAAGIKLWNEKTALTNAFVESLRADLIL